MKKKDKEVIYLLPTVLNGKGKAMEIESSLFQIRYEKRRKKI